MSDTIAKIYREIDACVAAIARSHGQGLKCRRGCRSCCVDDLTVFAVEAENIRRIYDRLLRSQAPHPQGACAFLDKTGGCRIYPQRPYVCRTQGLPLRWLEESAEDPAQIVEMRDICPLNDPGEPIEALSEDACWTIGPVESRLAALQIECGSGGMRRIALRALFAKAAPG